LPAAMQQQQQHLVRRITASSTSLMKSQELYSEEWQRLKQESGKGK